MCIRDSINSYILYVNSCTLRYTEQGGCCARSAVSCCDVSRGHMRRNTYNRWENVHPGDVWVLDATATTTDVRRPRWSRLRYNVIQHETFQDHECRLLLTYYLRKICHAPEYRSNVRTTHSHQGTPNKAVPPAHQFVSSGHPVWSRKHTTYARLFIAVVT